jgi:SAM-dependent methyltransferase
LIKINSTNADFFEAKYQHSEDPWNFASSDYEQSRYTTMLGFLEGRQYDRAFEPGCSIGEFTKRLAPLCKQLIASEISSTAARQARRRCERIANAMIICKSFPQFIPKGTFDLIVLSEIAYYFDANELTALGTVLVNKLQRKGVLLAAHWLGISQDHKLSGDDAHSILGKVVGLTLVSGERFDHFRVDKWERL